MRTIEQRVESAILRDLYAKHRPLSSQSSFEWTEEDEKKHPRNDSGEFEKKTDNPVIQTKVESVSPTVASISNDEKKEQKMATATQYAQKMSDAASDANKKAKVLYDQSDKFARQSAKEASDAFASGDMVGAADAHRSASMNHYAAGMSLKRMKQTSAIAKAVDAHFAAQKAHEDAKEALGGGTQIGRKVTPEDEAEHKKRQERNEADRLASPVVAEPPNISHVVRSNTREGISQDHSFSTREAAEAFAESRGLPHANIRTRQIQRVDLGPNGTFN